MAADLGSLQQFAADATAPRRRRRSLAARLLPAAGIVGFLAFWAALSATHAVDGCCPRRSTSPPPASERRATA